MKLIIGSIIIFSLVILFLFALFPTDISVSRVVQIRSSRSQVHKKIADLREWKTWNEILNNSFESKLETPVITDSLRIRKGYFSIELLKDLPDTVITKWQNKENSFTGNFALSEMNGQVIVDWTLHFHIKWYPWDKLASMFYEKKIGPLMEQSLINLQKELETGEG